jgi:transcriptional regulator with XRE-family HTH domain
LAATIKDIREVTGLSLATISKYLNGGNLLPENKAKIEKAIDELHYEVNEMARGLVTSRSKVIGVVVFDIANVFDMKIDIGEIEEDEESKKENILGKDDYFECIYGLNQSEFKEKFDFIFSKKITKSLNRNYTSSHSLNLFKSNTRNSMRRDIRVIMFINRQMKKLKKNY